MILTAMQVIVYCIIALLLLDAVVAINIDVVSRAKPVISVKDRDTEFYRVKIATTRRLRGHRLATVKAQKNTFQDEERMNLDSLLSAISSPPDFIAFAEKTLEMYFKFPASTDDFSTIWKTGESLGLAVEKLGVTDTKLTKTTAADKRPKTNPEELQDSIETLLTILNVIKAQRIIDSKRIPGVQEETITRLQDNTFKFWKSRGVTSDALSNILLHTEDYKSNPVDVPKSNLVDDPKSNFVDDPKSNFVDDPKSNLVDDPKSNLVDDPKSNLVDDPKSNLVDDPKSNLADDPKGDLMKSYESYLLKEEGEVVCDHKSINRYHDVLHTNHIVDVEEDVREAVSAVMRLTALSSMTTYITLIKLYYDNHLRLSARFINNVSRVETMAAVASLKTSEFEAAASDIAKISRYIFLK
ncbi:hypothetical protein Plhal703r1_c07g0039001 [Plasmopara halstedii]